ncbi:MAG TPA: ATP-binding cassette domain-containing protein [Marmoricola sp.]
MSVLQVRVDLPGRLRASITARPGEVVAVIGPNGAGKTTLLEAVAGTLHEGHGMVRLGDEDWTGLPPQERACGLVFQEHLLFPHLDARGNVEFGLRARGVPRRRARVEAQRWLERLGIAAAAERRPAALSGGQAQRVAMARALAPDPRVLLLDEPFAALDVAVAADLRDLLRVHLRAFTGVGLLVTHDALDVRALADRVVVLQDGTVAQDDTPAGVAEAPATSHAARLLGLNVVPAADVVVPGTRQPGALATFSPSAITLTADEPVGSARNRWRTTVHRAVERDGVVRVHLLGGPATDGALYADVTPGAATELDLVPGRVVWSSVKATEVTALEVGSTERPGDGAAPGGRGPSRTVEARVDDR